MKSVKRFSIRRLLDDLFIPTLRQGDVEFLLHRYAIEAKVGQESYGLINVHSYQPGGTIEIGSYTSISTIQVIMGGNHHMDVSTYPFKTLWFGDNPSNDNSLIKGIRIGSDCWVGYGAMLLDGVSIGIGSIIGAGSVVSVDIPPFSIAVGNPARVIRKRFMDNEIEALLTSKWWELPKSIISGKIRYLYSEDVNTFLSQIKAEE